MAQVIFARTATVATLALFSSKVVSVDDNTNPSDGEIFTQNAQDQSTA